MTRGDLVSTKASHLRHLLRVAIGQEEIGRRIARAREEAGLSQRELAERIGVADAQSVSRYERGITEVKTRRLERIAQATGKPMSFFVFDPESEPVVVDEASLAGEVRALRERVEQVLALLEDAEKSAPATRPQEPPGRPASL